MKYAFKLSTLIVMLFIIGCNNSNKSNNDKELTDDYSTKIDSLIQTINPRKFNGVILITQNGKTKYAKAHGYSNFEDKTPITLEDNFRIQSNSKQITAVLIMKEVENRKIDLNKPVGKYLPELRQTWADTVTVHQLLNMSSGIVSLDRPLLFKPGTDFHYSNPAYGLLGRIIKSVTGEEYAKLANRLFKELGMNNSYCYEVNGSNRGLINGYLVSNDELKIVDFNSIGFTNEAWADFAPAGGIISNVKDLSIWDKKLHGGEILKSETYKAMVNSDIIDFDETFSDEKSNYGYGVDISNETSAKYVGHAGRGIGFTSIKFYVPQKNIDVVVLENVYNEDVSIIYHFEKEIRKIVLNSNLVN